MCTGEKAHDYLCPTANLEQADERLHLTPEHHYDTDVVDIIWQLAKWHQDWKETEKPQWNPNIMSSARLEEEKKSSEGEKTLVLGQPYSKTNDGSTHGSSRIDSAGINSSILQLDS